ncbi:MAG: hypothetical protein ACP5HT_06585 [Conexivisphaera sp.]
MSLSRRSTSGRLATQIPLLLDSYVWAAASSANSSPGTEAQRTTCTVHPCGQATSREPQRTARANARTCPELI